MRASNINNLRKKRIRTSTSRIRTSSHPKRTIRMALLNDDSAAEKAQNNELSRMSNISSRLTYTETEQLDALAKKHGLQRSEFIRQLILDELGREPREPAASPALIEIIGLRPSLSNLMAPGGNGENG